MLPEVLVGRWRDLEEREPLRVGHIERGGRHGEVVILRLDPNRGGAGAARKIGHQQTVLVSQSPSLQASPRGLLDRQHGLWLGQQFAAAAFLQQGQDRAVIADDQRGPAGFEADEFLGLVLGRAGVPVLGALAGRPDWPAPAPGRRPTPAGRSAPRRSTR